MINARSNDAKLAEVFQTSLTFISQKREEVAAAISQVGISQPEKLHILRKIQLQLHCLEGQVIMQQKIQQLKLLQAELGPNQSNESLVSLKEELIQIQAQQVMSQDELLPFLTLEEKVPLLEQMDNMLKIIEAQRVQQLTETLEKAIRQLGLESKPELNDSKPVGAYARAQSFTHNPGSMGPPAPRTPRPRNSTNNPSSSSTSTPSSNPTFGR